jgi:FkbM family methyltransferase|tara:strand:- start:8549 stop:9313 length:765 start_codon:yes stop_codon:yes gene_type:complete
MAGALKKLAYKILPENTFLQILHRGFYLMYSSGLLKNKTEFKFHYAVKDWIQPTDHVVDIGANLGYFAKTFARLTPQGSLTCIEPIPAFYEILKKNLKSFSQVTIIHTALGTEDGFTTMVLPKDNGVLRTGLPHVVAEGEDIGEGMEVKVKITGTKSLFEKFSKIDYIKCDIEGFEWIVFQELKEILAKHKPTVQIELSEENISNLVPFFSELGYTQYGIAEFKLIKDHIPQKEAGDFLFVHSSKEDDFLKRIN